MISRPRNSKPVAKCGTPLFHCPNASGGLEKITGLERGGMQIWHRMPVDRHRFGTIDVMPTAVFKVV
jgi:hypothetical protein